MKNAVITSLIFCAILTFVVAENGMAWNLPKLPIDTDALGDMVEKITPNGSPTSKQTARQTSGSSDCIPAGQGKSFEVLGLKLDKPVVNLFVNQVLGEITGVDDVFLIQEELTDTCMADRYLAYADKKSQLLADASVHLLGTMADSFENQKDRKAIEAEQKAVSQALEDGDKSDAVVAVGDGFSVYNKKLKTCEAVNQEILATVWVDTKNLSVRNVEMLSLSVHIFSFAKENLAWAAKNYTKLKPFGVYVKGIASQTKALAQTPPLLQAHFDHGDKKLMAKARKHNNKAIESKLADENGLADDADEVLGGLSVDFLPIGCS